MNKLFCGFCFLVVTFSSSFVSAKDGQITYVGAPNISVPVIVGIEKGFFKKNGLDVVYQPITTGKLAMEAITSGRSDLGSLVITNIAYAGFQTDSLRVIASNGVSLDDGVVIPKNSPIKSVKDLKGKKIGLAMSTSSQDFLRRLLKANGLAWSDITPVSLQPPTMAVALKGGQVDAVVTWQPWRATVKKAYNGEVREFVNSLALYPRHSYITTSDKFLQKNEKSIAPFLKSVIEAEKFINANPSETAKIVSKVVKQDPKVVSTFYMTININMDKNLEALTKDYASWVIKNQSEFQKKQMPNYSKNFVPEYLKAVDPTRVGAGF